MFRYLNGVTVTIFGFLIAGGLWFAYDTGHIGASTLVFLGILTLALVIVAIIFLRKMSHPDGSVEELLYRTDHPSNP
jgi:RsiW-degrading membrane proteinase PrsW (M82 family)